METGQRHESTDEYATIGLKEVALWIFKYKLLIIILTLTGLAAGAAMQFFLDSGKTYLQYHANATMIVTSKNAEGSYQSGNSENPSASDVTFAQNLVQTATQLAQSDYVLNLVIEGIGNTSLRPDVLRKCIVCTSIEKTAFIKINVYWPVKEESVVIANTLMKVLPDAMLEKLEIGRANTVDLATTAEPYFVHGTPYIIIAPAAGLFLGVCAAVILGIVNRKIFTSDDISNLLQINTIAEIPYCRESKSGGRLLDDPQISIEYREACFVLGSIFQYLSEQKNIKTLYITSALSGEGKTTLAVNLSLALAEKKKDIILIDCDTRRSAVTEILGLDESIASLQDVLSQKANIEDALINYSEHLLVLRTDITEAILNTAAFETLINYLNSNADYIIIDTPPVGLISDALTLNKCVDSVLFVVKQDYANVNMLSDAVKVVKNSGAKLLGCVLNVKKKPFTEKIHSKTRYYKHYYSNGYYKRKISYSKNIRAPQDGYYIKKERYPKKGDVDDKRKEQN